MDRPDGAEIRVFGAPERVGAASRRSRVLRDPLAVEIVADGVIPASAAHQIPVFDPSSDGLFSGWKGGVYGSDRAVCPASLHVRDFTAVSAPFAPDEIDLGVIEHVPGEAVYAGLAFKHFGHFLLESTNRLWWPVMEGFRGTIVFQNTHGPARLTAFAKSFFQLLGFEGNVIVTDRPLRFDRVIVPHSAFTIRKSVHSCFRSPFLVAGEAAERRARDIAGMVRVDAAGAYLSRTQYDYRRSFGERRVENAFVRNDFDVFYMESLPFEQQILLMRRYPTLAGIAGSAFHTMLFSQDAKAAIYINRDYDINENFFMIDELMGNTATYLYNGVPEDAEVAMKDRKKVADAYHSDATLDVTKIFTQLEESRALSSPWRWRGY